MGSQTTDEGTPDSSDHTKDRSGVDGANGCLCGAGHSYSANASD